jgi:hypothetical protein
MATASPIPIRIGWRSMIRLTKRIARYSLRSASTGSSAAARFAG